MKLDAVPFAKFTVTGRVAFPIVNFGVVVSKTRRSFGVLSRIRNLVAEFKDEIVKSPVIVV